MTFDRDTLLRDVRAGMAARPREIPPKYFYDERGSQLFDQITRLPEYYPTRAERSLLARCAKTIIGISHPSTLVELGAGSSEKTRLLLDEMLERAPADATYIPVDVSTDFLAASAARIRSEYPSLLTLPVATDFSTHFALPPHPSPALHAFLGSTIGNFTPRAAVELVSTVRERMSDSDFFLLGVDLRKDPLVIERAYNDSQGITALFNRNVLAVINTGLDADFDISRFDHDATYNQVDHRIEMRLVSRGVQEVNIPGVGQVTFEDGERILTELSYKYDRALAEEVLGRSGLRLREWLTDDSETFALVLAAL